MRVYVCARARVHLKSCRRFLPAQLLHRANISDLHAILRIDDNVKDVCKIQRKNTLKQYSEIKWQNETCLHFGALIWRRMKHLYEIGNYLVSLNIYFGRIFVLSMFAITTQTETYSAAADAVAVTSAVTHMCIFTRLNNLPPICYMWIPLRLDRCSFPPQNRVPCFPEPKHTHTHTNAFCAKKRKFHNSECALSLWMIGGTYFTD